MKKMMFTTLLVFLVLIVSAASLSPAHIHGDIYPCGKSINAKCAIDTRWFLAQPLFIAYGSRILTAYGVFRGNNDGGFTYSVDIPMYAYKTDAKFYVNRILYGSTKLHSGKSKNLVLINPYPAISPPPPFPIPSENILAK